MGNDTVLAAAQRRALARLSALPIARELYLAGGTAVALHLGHWRSLDLDFFSRDAAFDLPRGIASIRAGRARSGAPPPIRLLASRPPWPRVTGNGRVVQEEATERWRRSLRSGYATE